MVAAVGLVREILPVAGPFDGGFVLRHEKFREVGRSGERERGRPKEWEIDQSKSVLALAVVIRPHALPLFRPPGF
jgi:hypothetical protein